MPKFKDPLSGIFTQGYVYEHHTPFDCHPMVKRADRCCIRPCNTSLRSHRIPARRLLIHVICQKRVQRLNSSFCLVAHMNRFEMIVRKEHLACLFCMHLRTLSLMFHLDGVFVFPVKENELKYVVFPVWIVEVT